MDASLNFAKKAKIPAMVVGATVVAIATTFPEVSVSVMSGIGGAEDLSIGTAFGSMLCNFALVLGLSFLLSPARVSSVGVGKKLVFFLISVVVLFILSIDERLTRVDMCILFAVFAMNMVQNIIEARRSPEPVVIAPEVLPGWWAIIIQFFVAAFAVGFGANIMVKNVDELSALLGLSESLVGTFIIAIGTNIPEFVTTISSIRLKNAEIGVGNIFGASIIDASLLIALSVLSSKTGSVGISSSLVLATLPMVGLIALVVALPIINRGRSSRIQGAILVVLFFIYSLIVAKMC